MGNRIYATVNESDRVEQYHADGNYETGWDIPGSELGDIAIGPGNKAPNRRNLIINIELISAAQRIETLLDLFLQ